MRWSAWLIWAGRLLLAGIFGAACFHKLVDPQAFAEDVYHYQLLPPLWVNAVALVLPMLEAVCAICLLFIPAMRRAALCWIALMLVVFIAAQGINLQRGIDIACGCFSSGDQKGIGWWGVVRNSALLAVTLMLLWCKPRVRA